MECLGEKDYDYWFSPELPETCSHSTTAILTLYESASDYMFEENPA